MSYSNNSRRDAADQQDQQDPPPTLQDVLARMLSAELEIRRRWPEPIPKSPVKAAEWILGFVEPPSDRFDAPRQVAVNGGQGYRWHCPYHDWVLGLVRRLMSRSDDELMELEEMRRIGLYWRGETIERMRWLEKERDSMRGQGLDAYRGRVRQLAKTVTRQIRENSSKLKGEDGPERETAARGDDKTAIRGQGSDLGVSARPGESWQSYEWRVKSAESIKKAGSDMGELIGE